jgi:hypothetical protein
MPTCVNHVYVYVAVFITQYVNGGMCYMCGMNDQLACMACKAYVYVWVYGCYVCVRRHTSMYVCTHVCMYACMYVRMFTYVQVAMHSSMHACMFLRICASIYVRMCVRVCMHE